MLISQMLTPISTHQTTIHVPKSIGLESILGAAWQKRNFLACLLWPLSLLFSLVATLRRYLYSVGWKTSTHLPVPVIVIGNICVGGTGKTPLVIWLVNTLRKVGYLPGVIAGGYAARLSNKRSLPQHVSTVSLAVEVGDEPLLISGYTKCPVVVSRDRVAAAKALLQAHPEVNLILSDDGLQHYPLQRDIEIILFDARGVGNGWLLPAGPLREPLTRRRNFTVVNATTIPASMPDSIIHMQLVGTQAMQLRNIDHVRSLASFRDPGLRIVATAGIGNPQRFFSMLTAAGLAFEALSLPDHYDFSDNPFLVLQVEFILITEKDAVKCQQVTSIKNDPRIWVVPVVAQVEDTLSDQIHQILEKFRGHPTA